MLKESVVAKSGVVTLEEILGLEGVLEMEGATGSQLASLVTFGFVATVEVVEPLYSYTRLSNLKSGECH